MKIIRVLENVTYKGKLEELGWHAWRGIGDGRKPGYV